MHKESQIGMNVHLNSFFPRTHEVSVPFLALLKTPFGYHAFPAAASEVTINRGGGEAVFCTRERAVQLRERPFCPGCRQGKIALLVQMDSAISLLGSSVDAQYIIMISSTSCVTGRYMLKQAFPHPN